LGVYNAIEIEQQFTRGEIGYTQRVAEHGANVVSSVWGIYEAAFGVGWEIGRAITKIPGYNQYFRKPIRETFNIGQPEQKRPKVLDALEK